MFESIGNTLFYLLVFLWGMPLIYITTKSGINFNRIKRYLLWFYPTVFFISIFICILIFGMSETKEAIGYYAGEIISILALLTIIIITLILFVFILIPNKKEVIKRYIKNFKDDIEG